MTQIGYKAYIHGTLLYSSEIFQIPIYIIYMYIKKSRTPYRYTMLVCNELREIVILFAFLSGPGVHIVCILYE